MHITDKMHRTLTPQRVPIGRIGKAKILGLQSDPGDGLVNGHANNFLRSLASGPARGTSINVNSDDFTVLDLNGKFR
jgi:hypothetical protein